MTQTYIGHSTNEDIRFRSSSGGVITAIIKYLFDKKLIDTFLGCKFNVKQCCYEPILIHNFQDYELVGSVYQDINLIGYAKEHISEIRGTILIVCSPCLVKAFRSIFNRKKIKSIILDYFCSGQTSLEGTYCFYRFLGINKNDVSYIRYRGNGWPNGIEVLLNSGEKIKKKNYTDPWETIHRSELFRPKRCFYCKNVESKNADISVGDPWLKEYITNDNIGNSLFLVHTSIGQDIIESMIEHDDIVIKPVEYNLFEVSQRPSIFRKNNIENEKSYYDFKVKLIQNEKYKNWAQKNYKNMRFHIWLMEHIVRPFFALKSKNMKSIVKKIINRIKNGGARIYWKKKIGAIGENWTKGKSVTIQNPQCLYFGNNVGIGNYTYFLPCIKYGNKQYSPKITIGDGTWIGVRNSFAAIQGITIGKNVLFAGYVHITDHSHGYEDITKSIKEQPLISKGPVIIEDNCWLGFNSEVLSGVHIGKNSVVAAHAVVTKDVPPYSIVAGNPAKIVKQYNFETHEWEKYKK